jgi:hypothetical protein
MWSHWGYPFLVADQGLSPTTAGPVLMLALGRATGVVNVAASSPRCCRWR